MTSDVRCDVTFTYYIHWQSRALEAIYNSILQENFQLFEYNNQYTMGSNDGGSASTAAPAPAPPKDNKKPPKPEEVINVNVGILGHVDSGKTSLVKTLSTLLSTAALDKSKQSRQRGKHTDCQLMNGVLHLPLCDSHKIPFYID